jgi:hypothetical protein
MYLFILQDIWLLGRVMCMLVPYIELTVSHSSVLIILAITIERYFQPLNLIRWDVVAQLVKATGRHQTERFESGSPTVS